MKIENLIVDKIIDWNYYSNEKNKKSLGQISRDLKNSILDPKNYLSYIYKNGVITKLIFAQFSNTPFELDRIDIGCFYIQDNQISKSNVQKELQDVCRFFLPKKLKVVMGLKSSESKLYKILKRLTFESNGTKLVGLVEESYFRAKKLCESKNINITDYSFDEFDFNRDIERVMKLEISSHRDEPTSVVYKMPKKHWSSFRSFLESISKSRTAHILKYKGKIIGFVGYNPKAGLSSGAFIVSISIDPKFKGRGLSKFLYLKMLEHMYSKKIKYYYGYSKTTHVLKLSKKLARTPCFYSLKLHKSENNFYL